METFTEWSYGFRELSLFSGAGGGLLGTKYFLGWRTVGYVEWNDYCQRVIKARIDDGLLDDAPIWDDVKTFDGKPWRGLVDVITAGFPCQPFSQAGKQMAADDERNMWPDTIRIIREVKPSWVFLENVPGLIHTGYIVTVLDGLAQAGYKALPPLKLSSGDCGAPHERERVWIIAHSDSQSNGTDYTRKSSGERVDMARYALPSAGWQQGANDIISCLFTPPNPNSTNGNGGYQFEQNRRQRRQAAIEAALLRQTDLRFPEPRPVPLADGVAYRLDRINAIGNGQDPLVAATAWRLLTAEWGC